jgi:integrase
VDLALLKQNNLSNGRISYKRRKTGKWYDIKLVPQALAIINEYSNPDNAYLLPITKEKTDSEEEMVRGIRGKTKTINKCLSQISEKLNLEPKITTYTSRHSWATIAKKAGYSIEIIAEALGHEQGNAITNTYLDKFDVEVIDDVNKSVVSSVFG